MCHYQIENESDWTAHTLALTESANKYLTSEEDKLHVPLTVTWLLRSLADLSTNIVAICFSSGLSRRDFSNESQGHILITPPSEHDHISPTYHHHNISMIKNKTNQSYN